MPAADFSRIRAYFFVFNPIQSCLVFLVESEFTCPKPTFRAPLWARGAVAPDFFVKIDEGYFSGAARCRAAESI